MTQWFLARNEVARWSESAYTDRLEFSASDDILQWNDYTVLRCRVNSRYPMQGPTCIVQWQRECGL